MPGDWTHWVFVALLILALIVAAWVWWFDRDRIYTEDELKVIEFTERMEALKDARRALR